MYLVKFHPEVASCLLSRGKRKYALLEMRLLWKFINYFLVYQWTSHFLSYLQKYKEFEAEILTLQLEKYGLSFDIKKYSTSGWTLGDENVIGIRSFKRQPRLLNLILLNLIVRRPMGAAIVRPLNTEYTQSIGACWEKLPKIVKITLLQFNYEFGHGNFFTVWSSQYFQNIYRRKKISIDGKSHNLVTKLRQVPCFCDVCLFSIQMKPFNHS